MSDSGEGAPRFDVFDRWLGLGLIVVTALVFLPWLGGDLVWDDPVLVLENELTGRWSNLPSFFRIDLWESTPEVLGASGFYRPLMLVDLTLDRMLFDNGTWGLRFHSLIWHLVVVSLFLRLAHRLGLGRISSVAGATFLALHPVQSEVVFFVSARNDSMAAAWLLGAILWLIPKSGQPTMGRMLAGGLCTLAAALCKESVLLAPVLVLLLSSWRDERWNHRGLLAMSGGVLAYSLLRWSVGVAWPDGMDLVETIRRTPLVLGLYSADLFFPVDVGPGVHLLWEPPMKTLALALALVGLGLLFFVGGRRGRTAIGILAVLGGPALVAATTEHMPAQRYLYLSMIGVSLIFAWVVEHRDVAWQRGLAAFACVGLAGLTGKNALQWQSDTMLWSSAIDRVENGYTMGAYAKTLEDLDRLSEAAEWYARATHEVSPPFIESCYNVAQVRIRLGQPQLAIEYGSNALENGCPPVAELVGPIGLAMALTGDWSGAREILRDVERDPRGEIKVVRLAVASESGDFAPLREMAGTLDPTHPLVARVRSVLLHGGAKTAAEVLQNQEVSED